jgi:hypothetical protein
MMMNFDLNKKKLYKIDNLKMIIIKTIVKLLLILLKKN